MDCTMKPLRPATALPQSNLRTVRRQLTKVSAAKFATSNPLAKTALAFKEQRLQSNFAKLKLG